MLMLCFDMKFCINFKSVFTFPSEAPHSNFTPKRVVLIFLIIQRVFVSQLLFCFEQRKEPFFLRKKQIKRLVISPIEFYRQSNFLLCHVLLSLIVHTLLTSCISSSSVQSKFYNCQFLFLTRKIILRTKFSVWRLFIKLSLFCEIRVSIKPNFDICLFGFHLP